MKNHNDSRNTYSLWLEVKLSLLIALSLGWFVLFKLTQKGLPNKFSNNCVKALRDET